VTAAVDLTERNVGSGSILAVAPYVRVTSQDLLHLGERDPTAEANRQSLSAFVVDRLTEAAEVSRLSDYMSTYQEPRGSGVTLEEATAAVREVREAS